MLKACAAATLLLAGCATAPRFSLTLKRILPASDREPAAIDYEAFIPEWFTGRWQRQSGRAFDGQARRLFRVGETRHACRNGCSHIEGYDPTLDIPVNAEIGVLGFSVLPDGRVRAELLRERYRDGALIGVTRHGRVLDVGETWEL